MNILSEASKCRLSAMRLLILSTVLAGTGVLAQNNSSSCGEIHGGSDYRTSSRQALNLVESYHFTPEVEALIRGKQSTFVGVDLSYTLGAFPNHHRALMSMMLLGQKLKNPQPPRAEYSVECYFVRALRFRPDDTTVRMMYASFLTTQTRAAEASQELVKVNKVAGDNAFIYYNMGQIHFDLKDYDKALENAHRAARLGLTLTGLRDRLARVGQWRAPAQPEPSATLQPAEGSSVQ